jgi:DNA-binding MarR family transcriptional regulator
VDPGNLVALLDGMDERGVLSRRRDPADRRRSTLRLTAAGKQLLARASDATHAVEDAVFGVLSDTERAALTRTALRVFAGSNPGAVPPGVLEPGSAPA